MAEIPDYKPNTKAYKEAQAEKQPSEKKKVDKIISGTAKVKKKSELRKFADNFISEDAGNVKDYLIKDVVVPNIVDLIEDIVVGGIRTLLRGDAGRRDRRDGRSYGSPSYVNYTRYSDRRDDRSRDSRDSRAVRGYDQGTVVVNSRQDAEAVIEQMDGIMETYGMVSVADLYDLVGMTGNYTDNNYGWTNIRNAKAVRLRDGGWEIQMPRAIPIK
jgi:hypothetical protein